MEKKDEVRKQILDSAGNVLYTYSAHWSIVNRLKNRNTIIKTVQIVLTAVSSAGLIATISNGVSWMSWLSGVCSAISLILNLYTLHFNLPDNIKAHTAAANELWDVKEAYRSLLIDMDSLELNDIRSKRDKLIDRVSFINKNYPGTDDKSFKKAQADIGKYQFSDGEAAKLLHVADVQTNKTMN